MLFLFPFYRLLETNALSRQAGQTTECQQKFFFFSISSSCVEMVSLSASASGSEMAFPYRVLVEESSSTLSNPTDAVIFSGICLVLGITCRQIFRGTRVPYTVALLLLGIALGSLGSSLIFSFLLISQYVIPPTKK